MKIFQCYKYQSHSLALYIKSALETIGHNVISINSPYRIQKGSKENIELSQFVDNDCGQPDMALLIDPTGAFFPRGWESMECPTAVYLVDVHRSFQLRALIAPFFDYIFIAQRDYLDQFHQSGFTNVYWLPLACDPKVHGKRNREISWDIGFVGNINSSTRARRLKLLDKYYRLNDYRKYYSANEISEIYSQSKIVFNSSIGGDLNMRVFEGMASGAMLVTDKIANGQAELFKNGIHFVEYSDETELLDLVAFYLENELERDEISKAGHDLVLSRHTYVDRCRDILETIFSTEVSASKSKVRNFDPTQTRIAYAKVYREYMMLEPLLDELNTAWRMKKGYLHVTGYLFSTFIRSIYRVITLNYYERYK
jgi:hypothetical protein